MKKNIFLIASVFLLLSLQKDSGNKKKSEKSLTPHFILQLIARSQEITLSYPQRNQATQKAVNVILNFPNDSINNAQLLTCAENYFQINDWENLKVLSQEILKRSCKIQNSSQTANAYKYLGSYYMYKSINDSAFYYFLKEKKLYGKKLEDKLSANYLNLAQLQYYVSDYLGAEESASLGLKMASKYNLITKKYKALVWLGILSTELGEYEKSREYYQMALTLALNEKLLQKDSYFKSACYGNIGFNYFRQGEIEKSLLYYKQALTDIRPIESSPEHYASILDYIANSQFKLNIYQNLPSLWLQATKVRDSFNVDNGRNYNLLSLSKYHLIKKDSVKAKIFADEALELSRSFNSPVDVMEMLKHLAEIDKKNAARYIGEHIKLSDSLQLAERKMRNKFARISYETEEIIREKDIAIKNKWIISGISGSAILMGLLLIIIRVQKVKQNEIAFLHEEQINKEFIYKLIHDNHEKLNYGRESEKKRMGEFLQATIKNRLANIRYNLNELQNVKSDEGVKALLPFIDEIQDVEKNVRQIAHDLESELFSLNNSFAKIVRKLFFQESYPIFSNLDPRVNWELISSKVKTNIYQLLYETLLFYRNCNDSKSLRVEIVKAGKFIEIRIVETLIGQDVAKNADLLASMLSKKFKFSQISLEKGDIQNSSQVKVLVPIS